MHAFKRIVSQLILTSLITGGCGTEPSEVDTETSAAFSSTCDPARARDAVTPYQRALLDTIATTEGTINVSNDGYNEYFTGKLFSDCTKHPAVEHCSGDLCSDAAGRYQFLSTSWAELGLPNFMPNHQDIGALRLITKKRGVAIPADRALTHAEFVAAMGTCDKSNGHGLALEWASLPPGCYGQPSRSMDEAWKIYASKVAPVDGGNKGGAVVSLRAYRGQYLSSQGGPSGTAINVTADRSKIGTWEEFRLIRAGDGYAIACQGSSPTPTYYVSAENGGGGAVHCNRTTVGIWETFRIEWVSNNSVRFRTYNDHYLSAQNGGGAGVDATRLVPREWETFVVGEGHPSGKCTPAELAAQDLNGASFWTCQANGRYVCDSQHHKVTEPCAAGCATAAAGVDDQCLN